MRMREGSRNLMSRGICLRCESREYELPFSELLNARQDCVLVPINDSYVRRSSRIGHRQSCGYVRLFVLAVAQCGKTVDVKARLQPTSLRSAHKSPKDCHDNGGQEVCGLECPAPDEVYAYTEDEHGPYEREIV